MDKAKDQITYLLGLPDDWDSECYSLLKEKIKSDYGLQLIIKINNYWAKIDSKVEDLLSHYFYFFENQHSNKITTISLRNNLQKIFIYGDEKYKIKITCENKIIYEGEYNDDLLNQNLASILYNLPYLGNYPDSVWKVELKLISNYGSLREIHEMQNMIFETENYAYTLFQKRIIEQLPPHKIQGRVMRNISSSVLKERAKLWVNTIDWSRPETIGFSYFELNNIIEYEELLLQFYEINYNSSLYKIAYRDSKNYKKAIKDYIQALQDQQPLFLKGRHLERVKLTSQDKLFQKIKLRLLCFLNNN